MELFYNNPTFSLSNLEKVFQDVINEKSLSDYTINRNLMSTYLVRGDLYDAEKDTIK